MKVSIIVATYNSASTLKDTLDSILNQSYKNVEILIQDGGSNDNTISLAKAYKDSRIFIKQEKDSGLYDAMNKGIARATGNIVGILNSDDFYANRHVLRTIVKSFEDEKIMAVYGDLIYVDENNTSNIVRYWNAGVYKNKKWNCGWMPPHPTFYIRREVYEKHGLFNIGLRSSGDYEFMLRVLYKYQILVKYIPEVLVHMRTGGQSNANFKNRWLANKEDKKAWELNSLKHPWYTTYLKPLRKIPQYFLKS